MPNFASLKGIEDELKVGWDGNTCKLIHKKCNYKCYHVNKKTKTKNKKNTKYNIQCMISSDYAQKNVLQPRFG